MPRPHPVPARRDHPLPKGEGQLRHRFNVEIHKQVPSPSQTILFAGGGTGGHIFPSLAIVERLREHGCPARIHFAVSNRPLDAQILAAQNIPFTPLEAQPITPRPWLWPAFGRAWTASKAQIAHLIHELNVAAVVAMGGFVSAPAVAAAAEAKTPVVLINLDAVPGRANRLMAGRATEIFSVYPSPALPTAQLIGLPLGRAAVGPADVAVARRALGLDAQRDLLFVTGASQGAESINRLMIELVLHAQPQKIIAILAGASPVGGQGSRGRASGLCEGRGSRQGRAVFPHHGHGLKCDAPASPSAAAAPAAWPKPGPMPPPRFFFRILTTRTSTSASMPSRWSRWGQPSS